MKSMIRGAKFVLLLAGMVVFSGIGFAQCKIAVVDIQAAVVGSNDGQAQSAKFDARVAQWKVKIDVIKSEIVVAQKQLNGQMARIPEDSDTVLNGRIQEKTSELNRVQSDAQK